MMRYLVEKAVWLETGIRDAKLVKLIAKVTLKESDLG